MKILLCGDGNGGHVFSCLAANQPDIEVNILSLYAPVREKWQQALKEGATLTVHCFNTDGTSYDISGNPCIVTDDPMRAMEGVSMIVFMNPAFTHKAYLEQLEPYITPGLTVIALPGQPGFEFEVKKIWKEKYDFVDIIAFESLPWACKMSEIGKEASIFGFKKVLFGGSKHSAKSKEACDAALALLQRCIGPLPFLNTEYHLFGILLNTGNLTIHPPIMYGYWSNWDGKPLNTKPRFYYDVNHLGVDMSEGVAGEVSAIAKKIMSMYPEMNLMNATQSVFEWYEDTYPDEIGDKSSLYTVLKTMKPYATIYHVMKETDDGKFVPDFNCRYLTEDVTFGMVPVRGIAELVDIKTPMMDKVIYWAQKVIGKEYLVDGRLVGKDIGETSCPQSCGVNSLEEMIGADQA